MEYRYSHLLHPSCVDDAEICDGIPFRCHRNADLEEYGAICVRDDWKTLVGPLPPKSHGCGLGPVYSFTATTIPECLPDRLEVVSYIMEFSFIIDDVADTSQVNKTLDLYGGLAKTCLMRPDEAAHGAGLVGPGRLVQGIIQKMMAIDPERAKDAILILQGWWEDSQGRHRFVDFDDYLDYRVTDCGSRLLITLIMFGMGLAIPPHDLPELYKLTRPVWLSAILMNDLMSWDKEVKLGLTSDKDDMTNGVWILMQQFSIGIEEARSRVRQHAIAFKDEFIGTLQDIWSREDLSHDTRCCVEAAQYMISGNWLWSLKSPRYHTGQNLTPLQIARMKHVWSPLKTMS